METQLNTNNSSSVSNKKHLLHNYTPDGYSKIHDINGISSMTTPLSTRTTPLTTNSAVAAIGGSSLNSIRGNNNNAHNRDNTNNTTNSQSGRLQEWQCICTWLESLHLEQYIGLFEENGFDRFDTIKQCSFDDFRSIGLKYGHAKLLVSKVDLLNNFVGGSTTTTGTTLNAIFGSSSTRNNGSPSNTTRTNSLRNRISSSQISSKIGKTNSVRFGNNNTTTNNNNNNAAVQALAGTSSNGIVYVTSTGTISLGSEPTNNDDNETKMNISSHNNTNNNTNNNNNKGNNNKNLNSKYNNVSYITRTNSPHTAKLGRSNYSNSTNNKRKPKNKSVNFNHNMNSISIISYGTQTALYVETIAIKYQNQETSKYT